jgi:hypothetical protein
MKHRLIVTIAVAALACASVAATASADRGGNPHRGKLYQFRGEVVSASSTGVQVTVEGGNHAALRAMLGQPQTETFTMGQGTEVLVWHNGIPTVGSYTDLHQNDWVQVNVRAAADSPLSTITATAAGIVGDHGSAPGKPGQPLFLYRGTYNGGATASTISVHVTGGNRNALRLLIGQGADQTFTYDSNTIFLLWQGKVPTVISASQLKQGDRITVRIRAPHGSTLQQVEQTPAKHVGDHEPANAPDHS